MLFAEDATASPPPAATKNLDKYLPTTGLSPDENAEEEWGLLAVLFASPPSSSSSSCVSSTPPEDKRAMTAAIMESLLL